MSRLRRYFITGLLAILPLYITVYFLIIIFRFIDSFWGKFINYYLKKHLGFAIPGLGFILGIITIIVVGFIATRFLGRRIFQALEGWFLKFPLIRQVYTATKEIINAFTSKDRPAFKKVVMVEYPSAGIWSIGFVTNDSFKEAREKTGEDLVHIFIATTPNPFTGFLILVPKDRVKFLDIPVEEGIKLIVSGGILKPEI